MRPGLGLGLLMLLPAALSGCAQIQAILSPPGPPAPAVAAPPPAPPAPTLPPGPGAAPATPVPSAVPAVPAAPTPSGALTPEMPAEQERRLREDAQRKLDETERLLKQVEGRPLQPKERETFLIAQSFLDQARKALTAREYERAANLATKARTLTEDLAK